MPTPPRDAVSLVAHVSPAPPRSWMPTTRPASYRARHASISRFSSNGSPTCTLGRFDSWSSMLVVPPPAGVLVVPPPAGVLVVPPPAGVLVVPPPAGVLVV